MIKFKKNEAPEGFGSVCDEVGERLKELDHFKKFEIMKEKLLLKGRMWKKKSLFRGENLSQSEILIAILDDWFWRY